jgi:hypothetical protein
MSNTVTIASLYWRDCAHSFPYQPIGAEAFNFDLVLPKSDGKTPTVAYVTNAAELLGFKDKTDRSPGHPVYGHKDTTADKIAQDFVNRFSSGGLYSEFGGPAIWVCQGASPTLEEIEMNKRRQESYANAIINEAENFWVSGARDKVKDVPHREAARAMGKMDFEWVKESRVTELVPCEMCKLMVPNDAAICQHCGRPANIKLYVQQTMKQELEIEQMKRDLAEAARPMNLPPHIVRPPAAPDKTTVSVE